MYNKDELALEILNEMKSTEKIGALSFESVLSCLVCAEADISLYLHRPLPLEEKFLPKLKELTKLKIISFSGSHELKSRSYQEGEVSESETYVTSEDLMQREKAVFDSLKTYRRCRIVK